MASPYRTLTISNIKEEVKGAKTFTFEEDPRDKIVYQPGQYLTFILQTQLEEIRRSYSITSTPVLHEPLSIGVKRVENGVFSRYLVDSAKVGDKLLTIGAGGFFTLPEDVLSYRQAFFFAAGSGITPIFSLMKTILYAYPSVAVVLIYSNSSPKTTLFLEPLHNLLKEFPERLHVELLYSVSADLIRARLYKDLLKKFYRQFAIAPGPAMLFYLCGPENYMKMCLYALRQLGVPAENIKKENFSTVKVVPKGGPPDKEPHAVTVQFKDTAYEFNVRYPASILQAAKDAGIMLPYSCQAGRCGSCVAKCLQGKVWMSYNEVLTDKSLKNGLVLTCVGHPIEEDVVLEIL